jgi:hypothetical protein
MCDNLERLQIESMCLNFEENQKHRKRVDQNLQKLPEGIVGKKF